MYQHYSDSFYYPVHDFRQLSNNYNEQKPTRVKQIMNQLKNPDTINRGVNGLSRTLDNAGQVLKVVQSTTPYIQEYAPVVKNIPAMFRLVRAFNAVSKMDDNDSAEATSNDEQETNMSYQDTTGVSKPKLFI